MLDCYKKLKELVCGQTVDILGLGVSNLPLLELVHGLGALVTVRDKTDIAPDIRQKFAGVTFITGEDYLENITGCVVFRTPGISPNLPQLRKAAEGGALLTGEMEVFLQMCPCKIIAVTGSDGKTTTTTLIHEMLTSAGINCHVGGNIGVPMLGELPNIGAQDVVVVELSSFQLMTMKERVDVAVVTNISPNHLDYHADMAEYVAAKMNVFGAQQAGDILVLNADNEHTPLLAQNAGGQIRYFSREKKADFCLENGFICHDGQQVIDTKQIKLPGVHNIENYMAAAAAVWGMVDPEHMRQLAKTFNGVTHRLEFVRNFDGVDYYNDSIGTSPARTIAGLRSFEKKVILIAGGRDKKVPLNQLTIQIFKSAKAVVLNGEAQQALHDSLLKSLDYNGLPVYPMDTFKKAVLKAKEIAVPGDIVLMSPSCTAFDQFENFAERGDLYMEMINSW